MLSKALIQRENDVAVLTTVKVLSNELLGPPLKANNIASCKKHPSSLQPLIWNSIKCCKD